MLKLTTSTSGMRSLHHCFFQEGEAEAVLGHTYGSNEESFFQGAQSVLASTGRPVSWPTRKRKSSQELDDDRIRTILEAQKEQLLAEAKSEILKYGNKSSLTEDYTRGLECQIEFQELDLRRVLDGYAESRRENDLLHQEVADRERTLRETQVRGIHEVEALKRVQEVRIDEFSRRKMIEDQDTIDELTIEVQELQNEINCMSDSRRLQGF